MRSTFLFILWGLFSQIIFAQKYLPVNRFSAENGLTDDFVTSVFTDYKGFLWIGTRNGLNKYDGLSFEQFKVNLSDKETLPGTEILNILEDTENQLWIISNLGISRYARENNTFHTFFVYSDSSEMTFPELLRDFCYNWKRNEFLILGRDALFIMDIGTRRMSPVSLPENLTPGTIEKLDHLAYDGLTDSYYMYSGNDLLILERATGAISPVDLHTGGSLMRSGKILGLVFSSEGDCWIYSEKNIWIMEGRGNLIAGNTRFIPEGESIRFIKTGTEGCMQVITTSSSFTYCPDAAKAELEFEFGFPDEDDISMNDFLDSDNGVFWVATSKGLYQYNQHHAVFQNLSSSSLFSGADILLSACYDLNNYLWLLSASGEVRVISHPGGGNEGEIMARKKVIGTSRFLHTAGKKDSVLLCTRNGLYYLSRKNKDLQQKKLFDGNIQAADFKGKDTLILISHDSLISFSPDGKFGSSARTISLLSGEPVIDLHVFNESVYILQAHQLVKYSLNTSESSTWSLSGLGMSTLPGNTCLTFTGNHEVIAGTKMGLFIYYLDDRKVLPSYIDIPSARVPVMALTRDRDQNLWFSSANSVFALDRDKSNLRVFGLPDGLSPVKEGFAQVVVSSSGEMCFAGKGGAVVFHPDSLHTGPVKPKVDITQVRLFTRYGIEDKYLAEVDTLVIKSRNTLLHFSCALLDFWNPRENRLQYYLSRENRESEWVDIPPGHSFDISNLKIGEYTLKVRGKNSRNLESREPATIIIQVIAPLWQSRLAILAYVVLVVLTFYFTIFFTTRQLRKMNRQYRERELIARKVEQQKEELTQKNKNITDSINYARRIQMALMPPRKLFSKIFPDSFILHIPKDIVSGDFYWINEVEGRIYFAAVDCTGHGVPGAFMSIIGFELLRRITEIEKKRKPSEILNSLSQGFETIFRDIEDITLRDGMDVAFCAIDPEMKVLEFSGAFNPLYLIRDNTISEIKGDRFSVGLHQPDDGSGTQNFLDHVIQLKDGDILYIFTDGYADQFGGPEGKKYKYRRFRHLLLALHQLPMERQVEFLQRSIMDWKGELDQVDDILVMGIRITHSKRE